MAVLNIRVDDRVRDQLKEMADDNGVSLSEFVRDLLMEAVVPVYERDVEHTASIFCSGGRSTATPYDEPAEFSGRVSGR